MDIVLGKGQTCAMGYHKKEIKKGVLGFASKIREELEELEDAEAQGCKILAICELADLYGALKACASAYGLRVADLAEMSALTEAAFKDGSRK